MNRQWVALALIALAAAAAIFAASKACDDDDSSNANPGGSGTPTAVPEIISEATSEREGIELTVKVNEEEYEAGDEIPATAVVKNNRPEAVTYGPIVPGEAAFRMEALSTVPLGSASLEPVDDAPPAEGRLEAGDELELKVVWDQQLDTPQDPIQAPPGKYSIRGTFIAMVPGVAEPVEVEVAVTFKIEGSEPVLTPLDVLGRAVGSEELQQWMDGRADNVICASPSTGLFYQAFITSESAAETFDFLYTNQANDGLPICGIVTDGNAWRLNFLHKKGAEPIRFNMLFDLNDGTLIGTEEPTPAPAPSATDAP